MKRLTTTVVLVAALTLLAAVVGGFTRGSAQAGTSAAGRADASTLTVWVGWSARELGEFKKVVAEYDAKNPDVKVKVVGGINDDKIIAALRSGNGPDVVSSFTSSNVGLYCNSGGWIDLAPYLKQDKVDINQFPASTQYYTQYKGKRCALPLLADVYGFYYNKALFKKAGLKGPPKTLQQLTAYAKKLTVRNADGTLKVVGYDPEFGFYQNTSGAVQPLAGAKWFDANGKSAPGEGSGVVAPAQVAEEPGRLLRPRQAGALAGRCG